jgi:hypothetical protein
MIVTLKSNPDTQGRCFAQILDRSTYSKHEAIFGKFAWMMQLYIIDGEPCSIIRNHTFATDAVGVIDDVNLPFPSTPESMRGEPQTDGGKSENDGERPNNALVVPLKKDISLFESKRRRHMEGGAVFFIIVIGGLLIVRWLYEAQR